MDIVSPTPFDDLNDLLLDWHAAIERILSDDLVGAYVVGGFALGAGDRASDCDFLVLTRRAITPAQESGLRFLHDEIPTRPGHWPHDLEGSYAPATDVSTLETLGRPWLYINRGGREMEWSTHCNAIDVRWVLRERAIVLSGPGPADIACPVPAEAVRGHSRAALATLLTDVVTWATFDHGWTQRYVVQTASRLGKSIETGEVASKHAGLVWARGRFGDDWTTLLEQVAADREAVWNDPPRPGSVERAIAFVQVVQRHAGLAPPKAR